MSVFQTTASALNGIFADRWSPNANGPIQSQLAWSKALHRSTVVGFPDQRGGTAWTEDLRILSAMAQILQPAVCVEVGVFEGASLRAVREHHQPQTHVAFDVDIRCRTYVPDGVVFIPVTRGCNVMVPPFDFAFLDDGHRADEVVEWLRRLAPAARTGAVIVVHDTVGEYVGARDGEGVRRWLAETPDWTEATLLTPTGMTILRGKI